MRRRLTLGWHGTRAELQTLHLDKPADCHLVSDKGTGRKYPEATARIVRLTYDIGVMKGSLDDTNAGITPGYPQKPFCHPFRSAVNAHTKTEVTFGLVPLCRKESSSHLHLTRKSFIT